MRIALCFSGQPRNVARTYHEYLQANLCIPNKDHQIDTFVHTWFNMSDVGKPYLGPRNGNVASEPISETVITDIIRLYNPKRMLVEEQRPFETTSEYESRKAQFIGVPWSLSKMYSMKQADKLRQEYEMLHEFKYDLVISTRFDMALTEELAFVPNQIERDTIYHPVGCPHQPPIVNIVWAMGDTTTMAAYATLYDNVDYLFHTLGVPFCDEMLAGIHMSYMGYNPVEFQIGYKLIRE